jgi:hypothetical protein
MKLRLFENQVTRERYLCRDINQVETIDGEQYLRVERWAGGSAVQQQQQREFLVRYSALEPVRV